MSTVGPPHCAVRYAKSTWLVAAVNSLLHRLQPALVCHLEGSWLRFTVEHCNRSNIGTIVVAPGGIILVAIVVNMLLMLLICQVQC
jgi:hypothetical protein